MELIGELRNQLFATLEDLRFGRCHGLFNGGKPASLAHSKVCDLTQRSLSAIAGTEASSARNGPTTRIEERTFLRRQAQELIEKASKI